MATTPCSAWHREPCGLLPGLRFSTFNIVEHNCHRCHAPVEEGKLFCSQCGAPQIRVSAPEAPASDAALGATPLGPLESGGDLFAWSSAAPKAAAAGLASFFFVQVLGQLSPLLSFFGVVITGMLAVWLVQRSSPHKIPAGRAARIGLVAGFFGFLFNLGAAAAMFSVRPGEFSRVLRERLQEAVANNPNPQAKEMMQQMLTPQGLATIAVVSAVLFFVIFLGLGAGGGALGASIFGPRNRETR